MPDLTAIEATYLAPDYHARAAEAASRMRRDAQARAQRLHQWGITRILEIGSGPGFFLDAARDLGMYVEGVDRAPTAQQARDRGHTVHNVWLDQLQTTTRFDAVVAFEVIEHLPHPHQALSRCHAWLVKDGILALSTPNIEGWPAKLMGRKFPMLTPPDHLIFLTLTGLKQLLHRARFKPITWHSFSNLTPSTVARNVSTIAPYLPRSYIDVVSSWISGLSRRIDASNRGTSIEIYARRYMGTAIRPFD